MPCLCPSSQQPKVAAKDYFYHTEGKEKVLGEHGQARDLSPQSPKPTLHRTGGGGGAEKTLEEAAPSVALWKTQGRWRAEQDHRGTKPLGLHPGLAFPSKSSCPSSWFHPRSPVHSRPRPKWLETGPLDAGGPGLSHVHILLYCGLG